MYCRLMSSSTGDGQSTRCKVVSLFTSSAKNKYNKLSYTGLVQLVTDRGVLLMRTLLVRFLGWTNVMPRDLTTFSLAAQQVVQRAIVTEVVLSSEVRFTARGHQAANALHVIVHKLHSTQHSLVAIGIHPHGCCRGVPDFILLICQYLIPSRIRVRLVPPVPPQHATLHFFFHVSTHEVIHLKVDRASRMPKTFRVRTVRHKVSPRPILVRLSAAVAGGNDK